MSHFNDYMEGVPVKISEKYKRPPRIELPYSVSECIARAQQAVESADYCPTFENNVLAKIKELRSAKETKKNERNHRLQLLEEAKQKKLDEIAAAEAEEKLKQLSVSEVSYPSTEEISALSADEQAETNCDSLTPTQNNSPETAEASATADFVYPLCSNPEPVPNILQPIQVKAAYQQNNLLDDPDPLQELKMNAAVKKVPQYSNMETLTFKDFENDTSSPFDNVELKTINDMEQLAQVLQSQTESATSCMNQPMYDPYSIQNCGSQAPIPGVTYLPNTYMEQPIQTNTAYSPQHYPTNGYYIQENCENSVPVDNVNMYTPNYQYYVPENPYVDPNYYGNQIPTVPEVNQVPNGYIPEPYYFHYPHIPMQYPVYNQSQSQQQNMQINADLAANNLNTDVPVNYTTMEMPVNTNVDLKSGQNGQNQNIKSRSRSVPDIIKELNDEIALAKLRANERSYNASPAPKLVPHSSSHSQKKEGKRRPKENLPNPFDKLPVKAQDTCQKISTMGFPIDRVARVCTLVGDNDKKIIEGLLLMGELLDLGFPEGRVSAALAKHEFHRDKALDELVA